MLTMVKFGIDVLIEDNPTWKTKKIGLVTNAAATTNQHQSSYLALLKAGFNIIKLFSPEHGFDAKGADGVSIKNQTDSCTQLPIVSLYGDHLSPSGEDLADLAFILFDIPDVGVRFYTYLWTLTYVLEACKKHHIALVVLDRPNPLGGNLQQSEGQMLNETHCSSFIGRWNIPLKHSCTLGELALYFNTTKFINADLTVIPCKNWHRNNFQPNWGTQFIPTSPAIRNFNAAMLYPGLGLLEATNISEGRGTNLPFEIAVAPWLNEINFINEEKDLNLSFNPLEITPTEGKYVNEKCFGLQMKVTSFHQFKALEFGLLLIKLIKDRFPEHFKWQTYPTHVNPTGKQHLDKLLGIPKSEQIFELPLPLFKAEIKMICSTTDWQQIIKPYLKY